MATCSLPSLTWLPNSDDVMCEQSSPGLPPLRRYVCFLHFFFTLGDRNEKDCSTSTIYTLSTAEAVVTTAVVCVVCSFTAGLLLGVLLNRYYNHSHKKRKKANRSPVYDEISSKMSSGIELHHNEAYGHVPQ